MYNKLEPFELVDDETNLTNRTSRAYSPALPDSNVSDELSKAYEEVQKRNDAFQRELAMARRVQATFIPQDKDYPDRPELSFGGYYEAMSDVGGDLYDVVRVGKNAYGFIIADVSGHGIAAALVTALVKVAFRTRMAWGVHSDEVCTAVNDALYEIIGEGERYVTAFVALLNLETATLEYTNAAHHPALLLRQGTLSKLDSEGQFLGMFKDPVFDRNNVVLEPGDTLLLYTDGIVETHSYVDEEYGFGRLKKYLLGAGSLAPPDLISGLVRDMLAFSMGAPPNDDRAILCVEFHRKSEELRREPDQAQGDPDRSPDGQYVELERIQDTDKPDRDEAQRKLYRGAAAESMPLAALAAWEHYLERYPEDPRANNNAGVILYRLGRIVEAESKLRQALIAAPGDQRIRRNLSLVSSTVQGI